MEDNTIFVHSVRPLSQRDFRDRSFRGVQYGTIIQRIGALLLFLHFACGGTVLHAQRLSRDQEIGLLTNQVGYRPSSTKTCLIKGTGNRPFEVVETTSGHVVFRSTLTPAPGDFGTYLTADFSAVMKEGRYYLRADTVRSYPFSISHAVYQPQLDMIVGYFARQRCGASTTGYLAPCHMDDGIRIDNRRHQDVTGGWHDASDLRKWVSATLYGVLGLARTYDLVTDPQLRRLMLDELQWGNAYFLKMQEPQGYVMDFIGGDLQKHSDNNRWTDNKTASGGKDIKLVTPNAGTSKQLMLVSEDQDDRIIQTQPVDMTAQYNFITAEAMLARIHSNKNPAYATRCLEAAKTCYDWCLKQNGDTTAGNIAAALQAAIEMYRTTSRQVYYHRATNLTQQLKKLQAADRPAGVHGFFYTSFSNPEPYNNIWNGCQGFIGLSDLVQLFPRDKNVPLWKSMITDYAASYLLPLSGRNGFGIVPWGLYEKDPGGNRKAGRYWYRYFMEPELEWWVGINSNIASAGIGLLKAATILKDNRLKAVAQKQLDWILGSNPFNSSTLVGTGYNHPAHFAGSSFLPTVPILPGAVLNGLGGDHDDMPVIGSGDWQISEYWTPMVAHTLWLLAELAAAK